MGPSLTERAVKKGVHDAMCRCGDDGDTCVDSEQAHIVACVMDELRKIGRL